MNQKEYHIVAGMSRDLAVGKFDDKHVYDAHNIRITSRNGKSSLFSVTNEKGTKRLLAGQRIEGTLIGHAVIENHALLFMAGKKVSPTYIWRYSTIKDDAGQSDRGWSEEPIRYSGEPLRLGYTSLYFFNKDKGILGDLVKNSYNVQTGGIQYSTLSNGVYLYDEANGSLYSLESSASSDRLTTYGIEQKDGYFLLYPPEGTPKEDSQSSDTFEYLQDISLAADGYIVKNGNLASIYVYKDDGTETPFANYLTTANLDSGASGESYTIPLAKDEGIEVKGDTEQKLYNLYGKDVLGRDVRLKSCFVEKNGDVVSVGVLLSDEYYPYDSIPVYSNPSIQTFSSGNPFIIYDASTGKVTEIDVSDGLVYDLPETSFFVNNPNGQLYAPFQTKKPRVRSAEIVFSKVGNTYIARPTAASMYEIGKGTLAWNFATEKYDFSLESLGFSLVGDSTVFTKVYSKGSDVQPVGPFYTERYTVTKTAVKTGEEEYEDRIYRIDFDGHNEPSLSTVFKGNLNFNENCPIEALPFVENEVLKKVYWVDGLNQPRVINVSETLEEGYEVNTDGTKYDFNRSVQLDHTLEVEKRNYGGYFPSGTVQYCFTYFNMNAQETNIIDVSPLYYLSPKDKGLAADENANCSFKVTVSGADTNYDYVRVYAILRTSENATPTCRIVGDYAIGGLANFSIENAVRSGASVDVGPDAVIRNIATGKDTAITYSKSYYNNSIWYEEIPLDANTFIYSQGILYAPYVTDASGNTVRASMICALSHSRTGAPYAISVSTPVKTINGTVYGVREENVVTKGIELVDNGALGSSFDITALLFMGGESVIADTIAQKDNTLFLGNLKLKNDNIGSIKVNDTDTFAEYVRNVNIGKIVLDYRGNELSEGYEYTPSRDSFYDYDIDNNRSSYEVRRFKFGEHYRLGIIGQYEDGSWSEAVWVGDAINTKYPELETGYATGAFSIELSGDICAALYNAGVRRIAPVVVYPDIADRLVICQGVLSPTVYNVAHRAGNMPFSQASWYFRMLGNPMETHNSSLAPSWDPYGEIQCLTDNKMYTTAMYSSSSVSTWSAASLLTSDSFVQKFGDNYFIDYNILTFNSPDLDELTNIDFGEFGIRITGFADVTDRTEDYDLIMGTSGILDGASVQNTAKGRRRFSYPGYADGPVSRATTDKVTAYSSTVHGWLVYPWHRSGSVNNQSVLTVEQGSNSYKRTSLLSSHITSTLLYARTHFFREIFAEDGRFTKYEPSLDSLQLYSAELPSMILKSSSKLYYGNVDEVLLPSYGNSDTALYSYWNPMTWNASTKSYGMNSKSMTDQQTGKVFSPLYRVAKSSGYKVYSLYRKSAYTGETEYPSMGQYNDTHSISELTDKVSEYLASVNSLDSLFSWWEGERFMTETSGLTDRNDAHGDGGNLYIMQVSSASHANFDTEYNGTNFNNWSTDPVPMRYKSHRHLVVSLTDDTYLPCSLRKGDAKAITSMYPYVVPHYLKFWENKEADYSPAMEYPSVLEETGVFADASVSERINRPYYYGYVPGKDYTLGQVYVADVVRKFSSEEELDAFRKNAFGGTSESALLANTWVRCGDSVRITESSSAPIIFKQGDTYLERWDCLKTTPYADDDVNSIVEILSTDIESRIHLDARYDRNRGLTNNNYVTEQTFNQFNDEGYDQSGNFFNYHTLDYNRVKTLLYPNMVTWSKEKTLGEDVDTWTAINMTSTLDLDGDKGPVRKLVNFSNEIFAFQDDGLSQILFNSRVQIPVSDNNPVEITNGYKVDGKRYLAFGIGLTNKWSLQATPRGMYWMDDKRHDFYKFDGSTHNLSLEKGLSSWFHDNVNLSVWSPLNYTMRTHYDGIYNDLYITTANECLVYSEELEEFISFMDYGYTPVMFNVQDNFIALKQETESLNVTVWDMWQGDYNSFFDVTKPFSLTFVINSNPTVDKVFNNAEWRSLAYDAEEEFLPHYTFDTIQAWNEHQDTGEIALIDIPGHPSTMKKKFNVFRAFIPRAIRNTSYGVTRNFDRIRNPWCYVKLERKAPDTTRLQFMDIGVDYFM